MLIILPFPFYAGSNIEKINLEASARGDDGVR